MFSKRTVSYGFLLVNTIVWGAALVIVKPSLDVSTAFRYLLYRFFIASVLSIPIFLYYVPKIKSLKKKLVSLLSVELLGTVSLGLLYIGLAKTTALEASLITTTAPIFTVLVGTWYLREREEKHELIGLGLALSGTILLVLLPLLLGLQSITHLSLLGNVLIIGQNIAAAFYFVLAKKHYKKLPKLFVAAVSFVIGMIVFGVLSLWEAGWSHSALLPAIQTDLQSPSVWVAAFYMATFGSIIGLTAYIKGQDGIEASEASLFTYLQPLVYVPLAVLLLGDTLHWGQTLALLLIISGVIVAERRKKRRKK